MKNAFLGWVISAMGLAVAGAEMEPIGGKTVFRFHGPGNILDQGMAIASLSDGGAVVVGAAHFSADVHVPDQKRMFFRLALPTEIDPGRSLCLETFLA